jgi:hypothetical protein
MRMANKVDETAAVMAETKIQTMDDGARRGTPR